MGRGDKKTKKGPVTKNVKAAASEKVKEKKEA